MTSQGGPPPGGSRTNNRPTNQKPNDNKFHKIQLKRIDTSQRCRREDIFKICFEDLNAPLTRLTDNTTGYHAFSDDHSIIDKLTSPTAIKQLAKINLKPLIPPDLRARRSIFIRQLDQYIGQKPTKEIKDEILRLQPHLKIDEIQNIKNYTHIIKLICHDTKTVDNILQKGLILFNTRVTPTQCEQETYIHILRCFKCYKLDDHHSHNCPQPDNRCSECTSQNHTYQNCTSTHKKCLNCPDDDNNHHRTLSAACPYFKRVQKYKKKTNYKTRPRLNRLTHRQQKQTRHQ